MRGGAGQPMSGIHNGAFCCPRCEQVARVAAARIAELERERDEARALLKSPAEACLEERWSGNGGCGACSICCGELRSEVERLRAESAWVPCSERMPEDHSLVLVTVTGLCHADSPRLAGVAWVSAGKWIGGGSGRPIVHQTVVAWRPLPAPYAQDGGDWNGPHS